MPIPMLIHVAKYEVPRTCGAAGGRSRGEEMAPGVRRDAVPTMRYAEVQRCARRRCCNSATHRQNVERRLPRIESRAGSGRAPEIERRQKA